MYVDESGDDGFSNQNVYPQNQTPTQFFVRSSIILHDRQWRKANEIVDGWRYSNRIPKSVEIHATEIRNGKEKYYNSSGARKSRPNWYGKNLPKREDRTALLESLCSEIATMPITVISVAIDKSKIKQSNVNYKQMPKERSWEFLIERYNLFLKNAADKKGLIISDAITSKIEQDHRIFAKSLLETSMHIDDFHFIESVLFEPSDSSNMLQVADVVAYAFGRHFNNNDSTLYNLISPLLMRHDGELQGRGEKVWPF